MRERKSNSIQIARGIAILLVIFHHICNTVDTSELLGNIVSLINRIHVVVFFVITGWLFEANKRRYQVYGFFKFLCNKFLQLFVPYFIFSFVFSLIVRIGYSVGALRGIVSRLSGGVVKGVFKSICDIVLYRDIYFESLWFVYVLFIFMVMMYVLLDDKYLNTLLIMGILLVSSGCKALFFYELLEYPVFNDIVSYIGWVMLGRWAYFNKGFTMYVIKSRNVNILSIILIAFVVVRNCFVDITSIGTVVSRSFYIQFEILVYRVAFLCVLYTVCRWLSGRVVGRGLVVLGNYSYKVYLIHNPWLVSPVGLVLSSRVGVGTTIVVGLLLVVVGSMVATWVLEKVFPRISRIVFGGVKV